MLKLARCRLLTKVVDYLGRKGRQGVSQESKYEVCDGCGELVSDDVVVWATVMGMAGLFCRGCVGEKTPQAPWWEDVETTAPKTEEKPPKAWCYHYLTPFEVALGQWVYLSGMFGVSVTKKGPLPDTAVYLASSWLRSGQVFTNDATVTREPMEVRTMYVQWPDGGVVPLGILDKAVRFIVDALGREENVEIGCVGGHGRTGTLAAAICVALGAGPSDALVRVWYHYCDRAVETQAQEDLIYQYYDALHADSTEKLDKIRRDMID